MSAALWSCPPGLQVNGCADYPQVLDTRQIWALSSVSVGRPSKPCYRIGAHQLAQLAFGKLPTASHGTSFALMVPDKLADQSCLPSQGVRWLRERTGKQRCNFWIKHTCRYAGHWHKESAFPDMRFNNSQGAIQDAGVWNWGTSRCYNTASHMVNNVSQGIFFLQTLKTCRSCDGPVNFFSCFL